MILILGQVIKNNTKIFKILSTILPIKYPYFIKNFYMEINRIVPCY
jgi:hypothetical protein